MEDWNWRFDSFDRTEPRHLNTGFAIDTMHLTCKDGDLRMLKSIIEPEENRHRLGVNWRNRRGATALMTASQYGHVDCVKYLISQRAKVDAKRVIDGSTPIVIAAKHGKLDCVKVLLETKSYPKKQEQGEVFWAITEALSRSSLFRRKVPEDLILTITEYVVSLGADLSITNNDGRNAIEVSARYGHIGVCQYLSQTHTQKEAARANLRGSASTKFSQTHTRKEAASANRRGIAATTERYGSNTRRTESVRFLSINTTSRPAPRGFFNILGCCTSTGNIIPS